MSNPETPSSIAHRAASASTPSAKPSYLPWRMPRRQPKSISHGRFSLCILVLLNACSHSSTSTPTTPAVANPEKQNTPQVSTSTDDPYREFHAIIARDPHHHGAVYHAARTAAKMGDVERALKYLQQLANARFDDALEDADFKNIASRTDYRALADDFATRAPLVGKPQVFETNCLDVLPEGTAYDPKRKELLISSGLRRTVLAISTDGTCREIVPSGDGGLLAVLGMRVDAQHNVLWVASTAAPFMHDAASIPAWTTMIAQIDLASGRVSATYRLPKPGMLNDLALTSDGRIYVTDSNGGDVYWVDPNMPNAKLQPLFGKPTFEGPNGIVELSSQRLLVAHFDGLSLIELSEGSAPRTILLTTPDQRYLGGIDGLASDGTRFVGIQNLVGRGRIWQFSIDVKNARVTNLKLLLRAHEDLRNPTTGVIVDEQFRFVADPKLQTFENDTISPLPAGRRGHRVLRIDLEGL